MIENILGVVQSHYVWRHGIFNRLAERKLPPSQLAAFLREMGAFCDASRPAGNVVSLLKESGFVDEAALANEIFQSENGHGRGFAEMSKRLLAESEYGDADWLVFDEQALSAETIAVRAIFRARFDDTVPQALYSLGVMLSLEMAANRQIIPGEVEAFVGRGHYGFGLADLSYLAEHAGSDGAERAHEDKITALLENANLGPDDQVDVLYGSIVFLDALEAFYDALERVIKISPAHP